MKKSLSFIVLLLMVLAVHAQQKVYICDGFQYETVATDGDITFTDDEGCLIVNGTQYPLADIDSVTLAEPMYKEVKITYSDSKATVVIPSYVKGVTSKVVGAQVTLVSTNTTDEILYTVSGKSSNGSLTIQGSYKLTLKLAGLDLASTTDKAPINIDCGKRIDVIVANNTVNSIVDCEKNVSKGAFYIDGHPEFTGTGVLNVTGKAKHAICAGEYMQIKKTAGTINILGAASDGIHCGKGKKNNENNYFQMNGGELTISNAGSDCIDTDDYGCAIIKGGTINLNVSQKDGSGLKVDSVLTMTGGTINLNLSGVISEGIRFCYEGNFCGGEIKADISGNGSKGIKAKRTTNPLDTVLYGGNANFSGTNVTMNVSGGTYSADGSKCMGIRVDNNFSQTDGSIVINVKNSAAVGIDVKGSKLPISGSLVVNY